ncbi:Fascin-like domain-containing protein [Pandoravirus kuranda]|uniref:Fascin-like domain-containing protein n=1 Tax=Pandoravirus kuranda TaxID=3019033 RepID=A0AA95EDE9_9VIRU|nr:Fascin-like domain-containing protein [Pandoravirus kuranda]
MIRVQLTWSATLLALLCTAVGTTDAYRYAVSIDASSTVTLPAGATDVRVTLWGAGGGGASTIYCGAGGGSGATILNRTVDTASWGIAIESVQWIATVGQGGAGSSGFHVAGYGGDGGETFLVARSPGGTQLFGATAYGGGGAVALPNPDRRGCMGGAGGGQGSSASGTVPGSGNPPGAVDNNNASAPAEGALVGDVKAGGAGAGHGFALGNVNDPFVNGAGWTAAERAFAGGVGDNAQYGCRAWGGAAGFGGVGGSGRGHSRICATPPPNSGAGGGSAYVCPPAKQYADSRGADGGVIIEYDYPVAPSPSATPSPTPSRTPSRSPSPTATRTASPSRTPTPSVTPSSSRSPTPQRFVQTVTLVSPISGKQLTPQEDGSVASLWYGASYKEKWTVNRLASGKYTFRGFNDRYLGANPGGWVRAEATAVGPWEQWDVIINAGDQWTLKSVHGTYMGTTTAGVIYLNNDASLYWTKTNV